jgi:outer membrane protein TolC
VTNSEAEVARQEVTIINAETSLKDAKENFFRAIYATTEVPDDDVELTDTPTVSPLALDEKAAIETAFNNRAEIRTSRIALEDAKLREELARANLKPTLSAQVNYNGSAQYAAELSPVNSDLWSFRYPGFNVSLNFSMPLLNKAAKAAEINSATNRRRAELSLKDQEVAITLEVRQALRGLQSAEKSIVAAEKSLIYSQAAFDAAQMRYIEGLGTQLDVLTRQRDLDSAKTQNANAKIQYANAQTTLRRSMGTLLEYRNIKVK